MAGETLANQGRSSSPPPPSPKGLEADRTEPEASRSNSRDRGRSLDSRSCASYTGRMDASRGTRTSSRSDSLSDVDRRPRSRSRSRRDDSHDDEIRRGGRRDRSRSRSARRSGRAEITPARAAPEEGCAARIWVGGLPSDVREAELEDRFGKFGRVTDVKICQSTRDTYAFLQFESENAAADAIEDVDQTKFGGFTIKARYLMPPDSPITQGTASVTASTDPMPSRGEWRKPRWNATGGYNADYRRAFSNRKGGGSRDEWYREDYRGGRRDDYGRDVQTRREYSDYSPPSGRSKGDGYGSWDKEGGRGSGRREDAVSFYDDKDAPRPNRYGALPPPRGAVQLRLENLPEDMSWQELKQLGKDYGSSCTFARTFREGRVCCGMIEYTDPAQVDEVVKALDGKRIQGCNERLHVTKNEGSGVRGSGDEDYDIKRYDRGSTSASRGGAAAGATMRY
ncbi:hypothetical protein FOL47_007338 [Perkinsus chesapeaki]|uniref:RRM domain-containing protein n=1 Tax=Perkinsus chesapeaki TaxID=330153 RepID=A0A7J6MWL2_PERCH|nr:hypothetical protein FOL47_007338 [Perkinsus chesapeaki]